MQTDLDTDTLTKLLNGNHLSYRESYGLLQRITHKHLSTIEMAAALTALKIKGETSDEIRGAMHALQEAAIPFPEADRLKKTRTIIDCVGTGGDGAQTLNISTSAAIVLSCLGLTVAKHGGRAVSSTCGSADLLEQCGARLSVTPARAQAMLEKIGLCFLFAPDYHPAMEIIRDIRRTLKVRTLFNCLGPLLNPLRPDYQLLGVYDPNLCHTFAEVLKDERHRALIVHGGGLDELALHDNTLCTLVESGKISTFTLTPAEAGLKMYPLSALRSQGRVHSQQQFIQLLQGKGSDAYRAIVSLNAGAALWVADRVSSIAQGVECVQTLLNTDRGYQQLITFNKETHAS